MIETQPQPPRTAPAKIIAFVLASLLIVGVLVWQAISAAGTPDPTVKGMSPAAMVFSTGVLVFREGLEAILVLAAVTAGMARGEQKNYLRAVPVGALAAIAASVATWFAVVAIIAHVNAPELDVQAATGLLAIVVLLVVMNWFFHKFYWTGWIANHSNRRKRLMASVTTEGARPFLGLALLGFTAIYREGFEVVLFLQDLRLRAGSAIVGEGVALGLALTLIVAALTFVAHQKLPYRKMLVITGVMLGVVLLVMVGESIQEMQQAGWLATTGIGISLPGWMGVWFSIFPNVQTIAAQALAAAIVIGSYLSVPYVRGRRPNSGDDQSMDSPEKAAPAAYRPREFAKH
ncbi:MAG: FTR1 family protein [Janthinobacterium lividum]